MSADERLQSLVKLVVCPIDHQPLKVADLALVERLNSAVAERALRQRDGRLVEQPLEQLLVTADGARAYPVRAGVAELLVTSAVPLNDADSASS